MTENMNNSENPSDLLDRQALIYAKELSAMVSSERRATEMLKQAEKQLAIFANDFGDVSKKNKDQNHALEIADFQLRHYISSIEEKNAALVEAYQGTICCLALAADFKDRFTGDHIVRMSRYSAFLALRCGFSIKEAEQILHASTMHDIGKIGVPDAILSKPGPLTFEERAQVEKHTVYGGEILRGANSRTLDLAREIALTHHERWDGKGYPSGLSRTDIPKVGRVTAIADVLDALTMKRPYKEAMSFDSAMDIIKREKALMFDPTMVDILEENLDTFKNIKEEVEAQELAYSKIDILNHDKTGFAEWLASVA
jgi:HD-GYP domain-containing protein (c-di-GMP phosphodiesterase class II)